MKYLNRRRRGSSWRSFLSCSRNRSCRVCFLNHDSGRSGNSRLYVCPSQATASGTLNGPHSSALLRRPELADEVLGGAFRVLTLLDEHLAAEARKLVGVELAVPKELLRPLHEVALGMVVQREPRVYGDCVATGVDLERHEQLLAELRLALLNLADLGRIPT